MRNKKYKGYYGRDIKWTQWFEDYKKKLDGKKVLFAERGIEAGFNELVHLTNYCRENHIKLILIDTPTYIELQMLTPQKQSFDGRIERFANENEIEFWNYSDDLVCNSKDNFYDAMHLNKTEATIFSRRVGARLSTYLSKN